MEYGDTCFGMWTTASPVFLGGSSVIPYMRICCMSRRAGVLPASYVDTLPCFSSGCRGRSLYALFVPAKRILVFGVLAMANVGALRVLYICCCLALWQPVPGVIWCVNPCAFRVPIGMTLVVVQTSTHCTAVDCHGEVVHDSRRSRLCIISAGTRYIYWFSMFRVGSLVVPKVSLKVLGRCNGWYPPSGLPRGFRGTPDPPRRFKTDTQDSNFARLACSKQ